MTASFFERLVAETAAERNDLISIAQIQDGLAGRISRETYLAYLAEAYHHVKHTVPLMQATRAALDDAHDAYRVALDEYIAEETGHEEWILADIKSAGGDAEAVRNGQPRMATEVMVAYAYDYVTRINPMGFFGMVFVLEGTSTLLATQGAQAVQKSLGLPPSAFRYLTSHGSVDQDHIVFLRGLMDAVETEADRRAIVHMARRMFVLFGDVFRAIPHPRELAHAV